MSKRLISQIISFVITFSLILFVQFNHTLAQNVPFYWEHINVNIDVEINGDLIVTEDQAYVFKSDYSNQRYTFLNIFLKKKGTLI